MLSTPAADGVVLNELLTSPVSNWDSGVEPSQAQWLELFNTTGADISIAGWRLTTADSAHPATFGAGATVPAHGYRVLFKRDLGLDLAQAPISLMDANGTTVDSVSPPSLPSDYSYARLPDGAPNWITSANPTLGSANRALAPGSGVDLTATIASTQATVFALETSVAEPSGTAQSRRRPRRSPTAAAFQSRTISEVRTLPDEAAVVTSGVVTMPPDIFEAKRGYIQADGAGIMIHTYGATAMHLGDTLTIKGRVHHYRGEVELSAINNGEEVTAGGILPEPAAISPAAIGPATEGLLVAISGQVDAISASYLTVGDAKVYVFKELGFQRGLLAAGQAVTVIGVVNASDSTTSHRLVPRNLTDIVRGGTEDLAPSSDGQPNTSRSNPGPAHAAPGQTSRRAAAGSANPHTAGPGLAFAGATPTELVTPVLAGGPAQASGPAPAAAGPIIRLASLAGQAKLPGWVWIGLAVLSGATVSGGVAAGLAWRRGWRLSRSGVAVDGDGGAADDSPAVGD